VAVVTNAEHGDVPSSHKEVSFRWHAVAVYQTDAGVVDVEHDFDELVELHNLIERGPDCRSLLGVTVTYVGYLRPDMSIPIEGTAIKEEGPLARLLKDHYKGPGRVSRQ
jgi:hypothetical protein